MTVKPTESETDGGLEWDYHDEDAIQMTFKDRVREWYRNNIYEPGIVALDDWRFKFGGFLMLIYLFVGTIGIHIVPDPEETNVSGPEMTPPLDWTPIVQITDTMSIAYPSFNDIVFPLFEWNTLLELGGLTLAVPTVHEEAFLLGTDYIGRPVFGLLVHATPRMLVMLLSGAVFATTMATVLGTVSGYKGGQVDSAITLFNDIAMTIPGLPLVMILGIALEGVFESLAGLPEPFHLLSPAFVGVIIMINYWGGLSRAIRSQVLTLREANYVEASRTMGVSTPKIIYKDVLPNLMPYILINFVNAARFVIFSAVGLYYLGVLPETAANWGVMLNRGYRQGAMFIGVGAWNQIFPVVIVILGFALGTMLMSQGMDRLFNPRVRTKLAKFEGDDEDTMDEVMNE